MKALRKSILLALLIAWPYILKALQPDWGSLAWETFDVYAHAWAFGLAALFLAGVLLFLFVRDMEEKEKRNWGVGIPVAAVLSYILALAKNPWVLAYIMHAPHQIPLLTLAAGFLLCDWALGKYRKGTEE